MDKIENLESVIQLLRAHKCLIEKVDSDTPLDQLEMESIRMAGFVMELEEQFSILVTDEAYGKWIRVGDIAEYIDYYLEEYGDGRLGEM